MINTNEEAQVLYKMLRPNGGATPAEIAGTVGKRTFPRFLQDADPEIRFRDQSLRDQVAHTQRLTELNNQLNQTLAEITTNVNSTKAEKDAALAKITELQAQLTTAMDQLKEAQNAPPVPAPSERSVVEKWLAGLWERLFKK